MMPPQMQQGGGATPIRNPEVRSSKRRVMREQPVRVWEGRFGPPAVIPTLPAGSANTSGHPLTVVVPLPPPSLPRATCTPVC